MYSLLIFWSPFSGIVLNVLNIIFQWGKSLFGHWTNWQTHRLTTDRQTRRQTHTQTHTQTRTHTDTQTHTLTDRWWGSRDGAVVRVLASHQCVPGLIPEPGIICGLSLLLFLYSAPRSFSPCTPVFPFPQKLLFPNSNSSLESVPSECKNAYIKLTGLT